MTYNILIVDDDATQRNILQHVITERLGYRGAMVNSGEEALAWIQKARKPAPDLILLDYELGRNNALDVMRSLRENAIDIPVIVVTAYGDMEKATACVDAGAFDFLSKPVNIERLGVSLRNTLHAKFLQHQVQSLQRYRSGGVSFSDLVGINPDFRACVAQAVKASSGMTTVLIQGEDGVGKEMFARAIHGASARSKQAFVALNCAMIEGQATGVEKETYTSGGISLTEKLIEANHGTLYLDGIGNLSLQQQAKLLRTLQENELQVNGAPVRIDVRIIGATNRNLDLLVQTGEFRCDLLHRIGATCIALPALRARRDDIHLLVDYFIRKYAASEYKTVRSIAPSALGMLVSYGWQGNIRQLENMIFRAVVLSDRSQLDIADFDLLRRPATASRESIGPESGGQQSTGKELALMEHGQAQAYTHPFAAPGHETTSLLSLVGPNGHIKRMDQLEVEAIRYALHYYKGHMSEVARRLGIGRSTLYRKIHDFDIA